MAGVYLIVYHTPMGVGAWTVEETHRRNTVLSHCRVRFQDFPTRPSPPESGDPDPDPVPGEAMEYLAREMDLSSCSEAFVFVSPEFAHFRSIHLPFRSEKKIRRVLDFELEPLLPEANTRYLSDFQFTEIPADEPLIMTASIPESLAEKWFSVLGRLGVRPGVITPFGHAEAVSLARQNPRSPDLVCLHATEAGTTVVLVHQGKPCVVRSLPGAVAGGEALACELHRTLTGFAQKTGIETQFDWTLAYDGSVPGLDRFGRDLEAALGRRAASGPLKSAPVGPAMDVRQWIMDTAWSRPAASPMKNWLNFCRGKYGTRSFFLQYRFHMILAAALALMTAGLWIFGAALDTVRLKNGIRYLDQQALAIYTATFPDRQKIQDPYLQMKADVQAGIRKAGGEGLRPVGPEIKAVAVLREISEKIDPSIDVEVSSFLLNAGQLVLSGSTEHFNQVEAIKTGLESSALFRNVRISSAAADKKGDRVNFKFNIDF